MFALLPLFVLHLDCKFKTNIIMMLQATEAVYATDAERGNKMLLDCINYACKTSDEIRQFLRAMQRQPINRFDI